MAVRWTCRYSLAMYLRPLADHGITAAQQAPQRTPEQRLLLCRLTLAAGIGVFLIGGAIFGLLSFALWFAFGDAEHGRLLHVGVSLIALSGAVQLLAWWWAPPGEASGVELSREDCPELFLLLDRYARRFGTGRFDRVLLGADMNAALVQVPEFGMWGRLRNTLVIGLPLLHSLSAQQFEAILAHELSHLALQRRPGGGWAAQLRAWWHRLLMQVDEDRSVPARLLGWLLAPHAAAYLVGSVRLAHLEEFEADRSAAGEVGAQALAEALIEVALKERFLREDYWRAVMTQFDYDERIAPMLPFRSMGLGVARGFLRPEEAGHLEALLEQHEGLELHPQLCERLSALQVGPSTLLASAPSAAERYLGDALGALGARFDRAWCDAIAPCCGAGAAASTVS